MTFWTSELLWTFLLNFLPKNFKQVQKKFFFTSDEKKSFSSGNSAEKVDVVFAFDTKFSLFVRRFSWLWGWRCFCSSNVWFHTNFSLKLQRLKLRLVTKTVWLDLILNPEHETPAGRTPFCRSVVCVSERNTNEAQHELCLKVQRSTWTAHAEQRLKRLDFYFERILRVFPLRHVEF